jgi:hypothetical protein
MAATEEEARRLAEELTNATNALSQFSGMVHGQGAEKLAATKADKDAKKAAAEFTAKMDMATAEKNNEHRSESTRVIENQVNKKIEIAS